MPRIAPPSSVPSPRSFSRPTRWNLGALVVGVAGFVLIGPAAVQAYNTTPDAPILVVETIPGADVDTAAVEALLLDDLPEPPDVAAAAVSNLNIAFASGGVTITQLDPVPADVLAVVLAAVAEWDTVIDRNGVPLEIALEYYDLGYGVLGAAGAYTIIDDGSSVPLALHNARTGYDAFPGTPDMLVIINSTMDWNLSTTTPNGDWPLFTVLLHELGHGYGFAASTDPLATPTLYARTIFHDRNPSTPYVGGPSAYATSGNLWAVNRDGTWERAYAPDVVANGSSVSHLDEHAYPTGSVAALMTTMLSPSEFITTIDPVAAGVMDALGWDLKAGANPPLVSALTYSEGLHLTLTPDPAQTAPPAATYKVIAQHQTNNTTLNTTIPAGAASHHLFGPMAPGTWTIKVKGATSGGTFGAHHTSTVTVGGTPQPDPPEKSFLTDQIRRLYLAYFLREADSAGLAYWAEQAGHHGVGVEAMSAAFAASAEFETRYGALTNTDFVTLVYANVLGRSPDAAGQAYWVGELNRGVPRGTVMTGFSESTEFVGLTGTTAPLTADEAKVWRLYLAVLERQPDSAGLAYWTNTLSSAGIQAVAIELASSPEFKARYGTLDSAAFVTQLYRNVLARDPDPAGLNYWLNELARIGRSGTVIGFSESTEFVLRTDTPR